MNQLRADASPYPFSVSTLRPRPGRLPVPLTSFVGRECELARVAALVRRERLVTLTGPGGSGKTRLAVELATELAEEFVGGVVFVDLSAVTDARRLLSTAAHAVGVLEIGRSATPDDLCRALGPQPCLLVLDNFEQLVSAAPVVTGLLEQCP